MLTDEIPVLDSSGLRQFGLTTGAIVAAIFGVAFPLVLDMSWPVWPWVIFGTLVIWAIVAPGSLGPIYRGWMRLGMLIGKITTPIVLTVLFLITILPGALLLRLFQNDPMRRSFDSSTSYRIKSKQPSVDNLERPY